MTGDPHPGGVESPSLDAERTPQLAAPSLPKGGGAQRGIGEKLEINASSGTASLSIPVFATPGRDGFGPQLSLAHDSGAGNGPFGIGWSLSTPAITRKTDKGVPRYADHEESDVFLLAGSEDLVPARIGTERDRVERRWGEDDYRIDRYRPRIEGLHARIERWTRVRDDDVHWRVISRDNVTSIYGLSENARLCDPDRPRRVYSWLLEWTWNDRGHVSSYLYKAEDRSGAGDEVHERHRRSGRFTNRYLKRVRYGRREPLSVTLEEAAPLAVRPQRSALAAPALDPLTSIPADAADWYFELVFDYGEHLGFEPSPAERAAWPQRSDPFSSYRSGFELRCARLCRRILMFHRFAELGPEPRLVRSTILGYEERPFLTRLTSITQQGHRFDPALDAPQPNPPSWPPLELSYSPRELAGEYPLRAIDPAELDHFPAGLETRGAQLIDLYGEGLSGLLVEEAGAWWYRRHLGSRSAASGNLAPQFGPLERIEALPAASSLSAGDALLDLDGDGRLDLVRHDAGTYAEHRDDGGWESFAAFEAQPIIDWRDPELRFIDLDGDGLADVLLARDEAFTWYRSRAREGYEEARHVAWEADEDEGPRLVFSDQTSAVFLADLSGDGLTDLVRVRNGEVCYWPNLGHGRFGARVMMSDAPILEPDAAAFDPARIRVADLDGSGPADLIYLHRDGATFYFNESGNRWSAGTPIHGLPAVHDLRSVIVADLLGNGTSCLIWSSALPGDAPLLYVELLPQGKPHLLRSVVNHLGGETNLRYAPSTRFYAEDRAAGRPWITRLPFVVHVVEEVEVIERVTGTRLYTRYTYHHGYFDGPEREFRGFGMVEQRDAESFEALADADVPSLPPICTKTWFHPGAYLAAEAIEAQFRREYWPAILPPDEIPAGTVIPPSLPDTQYSMDPADPWTGRELREACRALKGRVLRAEIYTEDGTAASRHPSSVREHSYEARRLQPAFDAHGAVFDSYEAEAITLHYERDPTDPRIGHRLTLDVDAFGLIELEADAVYARAPRPERTPEQAIAHLSIVENRRHHRTEAAYSRRIGVPAERKSWEVTGLPLAGARYDRAALRQVFPTLPEIPFEESAGANPARRLISWSAFRYRADGLANALDWNTTGLLAIADESYQLAFTPGRLALYGEARFPAASRGAAMRELGYVELSDRPELAGYWWSPSGKIYHSPIPPGNGVGFVEDVAFARANFFQPQASRDPFGAITRVGYDPHRLALRHHQDAAGNVSSMELDYNTMTPHALQDPNGNRVASAIDALGRVVRVASLGKGAGADTLDDPTTRYLYAQNAYYLGVLAGDPIPRPAFVETTSRERHGAANIRFQRSRVFTDGLGREIQKKSDAGARRIASGHVVLNNKGKAVREYEPFFSDHWEYEPAPFGAATTRLYDSTERPVVAIFPDHSWEKVILSPWMETLFDRNDTVLTDDPRTDPHVGRLFSATRSDLFLPSWGAIHGAAGASPGDQDAFAKASAHHATPSRIGLDTLGRRVRTIQHNGAAGEYQTVLTLDIQGNTLAVLDARARVIQSADFDLLSRKLHEHSADSGDRWILPDIAGNPCRLWTGRGHFIQRTYDLLRRPAQVLLTDATHQAALIEEAIYGDDPASAGFAEAELRNRRTRAYRLRDGAGEVFQLDYDLDGHVTRTTRQLAVEYRAVIDWSQPVPLEPEIYEARATFDALGRIFEAQTPAEAGRPASRVVPSYEPSGLVDAIDVYLRGAAAPRRYVEHIEYNARGQRTRVEHGNHTVTTHTYDDETFRLVSLETARPGEILQSLHYSYDPIGNITRIDDGAADPIYYNNAVVEPRRTHTYDPLYRLIAATGREHQTQSGTPAPDWELAPALPHPEDGAAMRGYREQYEYDEVGNIRRMIHDWIAPNGAPGVPGNRWIRAFQYDPQNNRLQSTQLGAVVTAYAHDAHGNLRALPHLPSAGGRDGMEWDASDRLHRVQKGGGGEVYFTYDSSGQRVRKIWERAGTTVDRVYLSGFELVRTRAGAVLREEWETLHVADGARREAIVETKTVDLLAPATVGRRLHRHQLDDHLGTACIELDEAGDVISYEEFHPYGSTAFHSVRAGEEVPRKRYRHSGMERDEETGLQYHSARYYAPWLGRWTSCDPAGLADGTNRYAYCKGSPIQRVDPSGTTCDPELATCMPEEPNASTVAPEQLVCEAPPPPPEPPPRSTATRRSSTLPATVAPTTTTTTTETSWTTYLVGGLQVVGGSLECVAGVAALCAPEPTGATKVGGVLLLVHCSDTVSTGVLTLTTGETQRTLTAQGGEMIATGLGASEGTAHWVGVGTDLAVGLGGGGLASAGSAAPRVLASTSDEVLGAAANSSDEMITIFRGTSHGAELQVLDETGMVMSDAARIAYLEATGAGASMDDALAAARAASESAHARQLATWWNSLDDYAQAHGAFGQEIAVFGPRSMISFTTDVSVTARFVNGGRVISTTVPRSSVLFQTLEGSTEAEVFIIHMLPVVP